MKHRILVILTTLSLVSVLLLGSIKASWAIQKMTDFVIQTAPNERIAQALRPEIARSQWYNPPGVPTVGCSLRPKLYPPQPNIETTFVPGTLTLERFRNRSATVAMLPNDSNSMGNPLFNNYRPDEQVTLAHPTNFGERYLQDVNGVPVSNLPVIVLHETVIPAWQTVRVFQTAHPRDEDQASYHALIKRDGTIFYLVPPDKRAFGAGNSMFNGEAVKTNRLYSSSVNNFAYHISFESPPDGRGNGNVHSGYTDQQYRSAAWLVAKTGVSEERITTHQAVDRSGTRKDPRSFNRALFLQLLRQFPKSQEIAIGCPANGTIPSAPRPLAPMPPVQMPDGF
ncbi:MAG TPA: peptidoglycan recognition family protein [Stenomitos sp.]